jgi:hypothetical protein
MLRFKGEEPCFCDLLDNNVTVSDWNFIWLREKGNAQVDLVENVTKTPFKTTVLYEP